MTDLFSSEGRQAFQRFVQPGMLCLFDFDGTLAPLVPEPDRAALPQAVQARLRQLQQLAKVGVVTGRSLADLRRRLEFTPDYLVGNHGLEGLPGWQQRAGEFTAICSGWRDALAAQLSGFDPGLRLEDKRYSLALHYRQAHDRQDAERWLAERFGKLSPAPRVIPGKCVFNLLPPEAGDKGRAVAQLIATERAKRTLYVGDDVTDEDVFVLRRPDVFGVRVGCRADSHAPYCIFGPHAMEDMLEQLLACLVAAVAPARPLSTQARSQ